MGWLLPLSVLAVAVCCGGVIGVVMWYRRRRREAAAMARLSVALPRVRLRSQVIVLPVGSSEYRVRDRDSEVPASEASTSKAFAPPVVPLSEEPTEGVAPSVDETASIHSAPTRELAAYVEELAALSMQDFPTRALAIHQAPTRELAVDLDDPRLREHAGLPPVSQAISGRPGTPSGFQPRTRTTRDRREQDATLRMGGAKTRGPDEVSIEELLRMLGPSPVPDLGSIEIYYRLGLAYLAVHEDVQARRCFLTVEEISPGYRDAAAHLTELPIYAPTSSGPTPVHHVVTSSGRVPKQSGGMPTESELALGRRNGR